MIVIGRYTLVLYFLSVLFNICHLISHSTTTMKINYDPSDDYNALESSKSFSHGIFRNFSLFHLITQDGKTSLFVVSNNDTIIELAIEDLRVINIYSTDFCSHLPKYQCEDSITINVLSDISLFQKKMIWFCYIPLYHYLPNSISAHCILPKNRIMSQDLTWTKRGFTSTNHADRTFIIQTKPYIFIGSSQEHSLVILRTKLPNYDGRIDSDFDLVTPKAEFYFEKYSHFMAAFETKFEVYYVIQEPITSKSHSISECISPTDSKSVINTRLIKICKDDPGSAHHDNERNFGTAAKADIVCPVGIETEQYYYTRSLSASWSGDRLYILYDSQKNSPSGKIICVYDSFSFNAAFNSDMMHPRMFSTLDKENQRVNKPIENVCQKLTGNSLNDKERIEATTMSLNGLYRSKYILPIRKVPVMRLGNLGYHTINTFKLSHLDPTTIIVLISEGFLRIVSHMDDYSICHIKDFRFEQNEIISNVEGTEIKTKVFIHVSTNKRMLQLDLSSCDKYQDQSSCLNNAPNICGWDWRQNICTVITEEVEILQWQRSLCKSVVSVDDIWSQPEKCKIRNDKETLSCNCRYCLHDTGCSDGQRVDITNCTDSTDLGTYDVWSSWSECFSEYQRRIKRCRGPKCIGAKIEYRKCPEIATTTNWTRWYKAEDNEYRVSFRAKCPKNQLESPVMEERQRYCRKSCLDSSLKWSFWSECIESNIQYRLLNCTSFDVCPTTRTEVKGCPLKSRKSQYSKETNGGGYSIIHIILATFIASLVWLVILISISILLFRYNYHYKKKSKTRSSKSTNNPNTRITSSYYPPYFTIPQKSFLSETSNDYLSSGFPSPTCNIDYTSTLFTGSIQSDQVTHGSTDNI